MKSFIGYLLVLSAVITLTSALNSHKYRRQGKLVKRQNSVPAPTDAGNVTTDNIPSATNYQTKIMSGSSSSAPSSSGQQSQSYSAPPQIYHSRPVSYTPPQITFHPPKIYMTKPVVTVSQAVFQTEGGPPVYQTATYTTRRRSSNSTEEILVDIPPKTKHSMKHKHPHPHYSKVRSQ